jgi:hypothetical protein
MRAYLLRLLSALWIAALLLAPTTTPLGAQAPTATPDRHTLQQQGGGHGRPLVVPTEALAGEHGLALDEANLLAPSYADDFSDPDSGWTVWSAAESSGAYAPGGFELVVSVDNWAAWSVDQAIPTLTDFRMEVDATLLGGAPQSSYGLVARYADDQHLYAFEISGQGRYRVTKLQDQRLSALVGWAASTAIRPAPATNRLAVTCAGAVLAFEVNGQEVARVSDEALQSGQVGLIASRFKGNRPDELRVRFGDVVVMLGAPDELLAQAGRAAPQPTARIVLVQPTKALPTATTAPSPTAAPPPPPPRPAPLPSQGFAGTWDTNYGLMTLVISGLSVDGPYAHKNGNIMAALSPDGRTITGTWDQDPTHNPPNDAGRMVFHLSDDGQSWSGTWGYGTDESGYSNGGVWTGVRVASAHNPPPASEPTGGGWCKARPVPGAYSVYFTIRNDRPLMCMLDKAGGPPLLPSADAPLTLKGPNPQVGDHIYLDTDGPDEMRFFNLMWDCGTNPGAYSPCDFWAESLWNLPTDIVVNQANQMGVLNLSYHDNWAGVRKGFEPRRYPGDPVFRLLIGAR